MDRAILFDIGNVLIAIDFEQVFAHWAASADVPVERIRERFHPDQAYERFERGEIDGRQYFAHLRELLDIDLTDEDFTAGWNAVFRHTIIEMQQLVETLATEVPIYAFSNTNAVHSEYWLKHHGECTRPMQQVFLSHEIGQRKPERAAFDAVIQQIGLAAENILFIDDCKVNIKGAKQAGLHGHHFTTPTQLKAVLTSYL